MAVRIVCLLLIFLPGLVFAQSQWREKVGNTEFIVEQLAEGLGVPWGLAFLTPNQLLITEREARVKLLDLDTGRLTVVEGLPAIHVSGQGGLMDVAVADDYPNSGWIYFTYSKPHRNNAVTTLARARLKNSELEAWQDLLVTHSFSTTGRHFGSRIIFDGEGHVFFGVGDRGHRPNGQDLTNHASTVLRLKLDGSIPADNPFIGAPDVLPEIWSYGHRNPQGMAYDKINKRLWLIEHGPRGGDEINLVKQGRNYGWPVVSHGKEYWGPFQVGEGKYKAGIEPPVKVFTPSTAPSSLLLYSGKAFPQWRGSLFSGALKLTHLNRVVLNEKLEPVLEERLLDDWGERIRDVIEDDQGRIIFSTDSGKLFRIRPAD